MLFLLFFNILFVTISYVVGSVFLHYVSANGSDSQNTFFNASKLLVSGLIIIVSIFSIIITKGCTINTLFLLLLISWFLLKPKDAAPRKSAYTPFPEYFRSWGIISVGLIACTLICFATHHFFSASYYSTGFSDFYYYAYNGSKMVENGIEGTDFTSVLTNAADYRVTYHYFDMWILGLFRLLSFGKIPLLHIYFFNFTPVVLVICWVSLLGVCQHFKKRVSWFDCILTALLVFYLFPATTKFYGSDNILTMPKVYVSFIISSIAFIYLLQEKIIQTVIILFLMPVMNILAMPAIAASTGLLIVIYFFQKKWKSVFQLSALLLIFIIALLGFYKIFGNPTSKLSIKGLSASQYGIGFIKVFGKGFLQMLTGLSILAVVMFFYRKTLLPILRRYKFAFISMFVLLLLSYVTSFIFWFNFDAFQIRNYPGTSIITILFTAIFAIVNGHLVNAPFSRKSKLIFNSTCILFLCFTFYKSLRTAQLQTHGFVSRNFVREISGEIKKGDVYGYVYSAEKAKESKWIYNPNLVLFNLNFVGLVNKDVSKVCLNTLVNDDSLNSQTLFPPALLKKGEFKKFTDAAKMDSSTIEGLQYQYAMRRKLNFLVLQKNTVLSPLFNNNIRKEIIDPLSGNRVVFLKQQND